MSKNVDCVIYSEAIITRPDLSAEENLIANPELAEARQRWIPCLSYPEALAEIFNSHYGIAVTGSHGKSTTTSMLGTLLARTSQSAQVVVGTRVPQFGMKNYHIWATNNMVIEACEYKHSFYKYHPKIAIITNIDLDHTDFYASLEVYIQSFVHFATQVSDVLILSASCENSRNMYELLRKESQQPKQIIWVDSNNTPKFEIQVPGEHLMQDARLAFHAARCLWVAELEALSGIEAYQWCWRRSEYIGVMPKGALLFSDYGHHPNELLPTLGAFRAKYPNHTFIVAFQPHQYARTREFLQEFAQAFGDCDTLIMPNIYFSRDKQEDVDFCSPDRIIEAFSQHHPDFIYAYNLESLVLKLQEMDQKNTLILLQGAGDIDGIRGQLCKESTR
jgi:UDP-N-acetylmuramate--alanine ligase